ncbi:hypothetical protein GQ44DRAFT_311125 [Phaeosphaeriaceae sp. PMI808]|nr:hypothetical protein GQ44DRAFT_311125 [Phaeosphaeriaceae sp. PMI808]
MVRRLRRLAYVMLCGVTTSGKHTSSGRPKLHLLALFYSMALVKARKTTRTRPPAGTAPAFSYSNLFSLRVHMVGTLLGVPELIHLPHSCFFLSPKYKMETWRCTVLLCPLPPIPTFGLGTCLSFLYVFSKMCSSFSPVAQFFHIFQVTIGKLGGFFLHDGVDYGIESNRVHIQDETCFIARSVSVAWVGIVLVACDEM